MSTAEAQKSFKIVIEGNVGCGKSTLLSHFQNDSQIEIIPEPVNQW